MQNCKYYATFEKKADVLLTYAFTMIQAAQDAIKLNGYPYKYGELLKIEMKKDEI